MRTTAAAIPILIGMILVTALYGQEPPGTDRLPAGSSSFYRDAVRLDLAPNSPFLPEIRDNLESLSPRVGIEISLSIPVRPEAFTEEGLVRIYNILRSPSTMQGIEYYSASRGEMRTFYSESYAVAGPDGDERIPDPVVSAIPPRSTVWAFQEDGSFGRNVQRIDYTYEEAQFLMTITNETTMIYKIVPLVRPGNLRTFLIVQPDPQSGTITFYGNLAVRVPGMFGMEDRARDSFFNRIVALHDWFSQELVRAGLAR
jgi:hypothetical protein